MSNSLSTYWTFETDNAIAGVAMTRSGRRFESPMEAALAAAEWLECCAVNGAIVTVRLACVVVKEEHATCSKPS